MTQNSSSLEEPLLPADNSGLPSPSMQALGPNNNHSNDDANHQNGNHEEEPRRAHEQQTIPQNESLFHEQPIPSSHEDTPWYKCPLQLIAMLSNYSTSYNVVNISMVIPILKQMESGTTSEDEAFSASSLLAGMIVGQLVGGYLGDSPVLGRLGALQLVMALQVIASLGSSMLGMHGVSRETLYTLLAGFRFLLGMGAGGVYPLAAVLSAEQGSNNKDGHHRSANNNDNINTNNTATESEGNIQEEEKLQKARRVVLTFSMQGLGFITPPLMTVPLLYMTTNLNLVWRLILALGSVPGIILMVAQLYIYQRDSHQPVPLTDDADHLEDVVVAEENTNQQSELDGSNEEESLGQAEEGDAVLIRDMVIMEEQLRENTSRWATIRHEPNLVQKLLGTAGTWFLFDVLFYGNSLFQSVVIDAAFGASHKGDPISELRDDAVNSLILTSIALPGYAVAGLVMGKRFCCILQTPKFVMLQGFAAMGILYFTIGFNWSYLKHTPVLLVALYGLTFFYANYGPNTTTFIFPSLVFSPECRTTLNGVSAAAGKLGAWTGATFFEPLAEDLGDAHVMVICGAVALIAFGMTWKFVQVNQDVTNTHSRVS